MRLERTPLRDLIDSHGEAATPCERLQALVSAIVGECAVNDELVLGFDCLRSRDRDLQLPLAAVVGLLRLVQDVQQKVVELPLAELAAAVQEIHQFRQQRSAATADLPGVQCGRDIARFRLLWSAGERVVDAPDHVAGAVFKRLIAQDVFSIHGEPSA